MSAQYGNNLLYKPIDMLLYMAKYFADISK